MFKRRKPRKITSHIGEFIWPSMGWKRFFRYVMHRTIRLSGNNYSIAAGLASGAAISSTPIFGTHIIQALIITYIIRGNLIASAIGTLWGNPWTFPFLLFMSYETGMYVLDLAGLNSDIPEMAQNITMTDIFTNYMDFIIPMTVGGYICAIILWPLYFAVFYILIRNAKAAKMTIKKRRIKKVAKEITGQDK